MAFTPPQPLSTACPLALQGHCPLVFQPPEFDDDASRLKAEDRDVEVVVRVDLFQLLEDPG